MESRKYNSTRKKDEKGKKDEKKNEGEKKQDENRSILSLDGAKKPLSLYTRRVMNVQKIKEFLKEDSTHGLCGGRNLGNTCFMNSSIACLSNCIELTYYFLCGDYEKDINPNNKFGMDGDLARSWFALLQQYWIDHTSVGNPSEFKHTIGRKAIRFRGFGQQDSNEFMNVFIENLHEDLKKETESQYKEINEKGEKENEKDCSRRFWNYYLERNDSIITDLFCGLFKSTVTCPECSWKCITFEPFTSINLPIVNKNEINKTYFDSYTLIYIPKYFLRTPVRLFIENISKSKTFDKIIEKIKAQENFLYKNIINKMCYMKVVEKEYKSFIEGNSKIEDYSDNFYFCFDIINDKEKLKIPLYFSIGKSGFSEFPRLIFGSAKMTLGDLRKKIYYNIRKLIYSPLLKEKEEIDSVSIEIGKYIKDIKIKDEYIFDLIEKEYQAVFNPSNKDKDEEKAKYINKFMKNAPFILYLVDKENKKTPILNVNNIKEISPEFINLTKIETFDKPMSTFLEKINDYKVLIELKTNSEYLNLKTFKLNACVKSTFDFDEADKKEKNSSRTTLFDCIEEFCKEEKLGKGNEWFCKKCKKNTLAQKKIELYYLPKLLIICFKRFRKESYRWEKNDENIDFPIKDMNMKQFLIGPDKNNSIYDLFAVSQHYGSTGFGHYTAICKNFDNWYSYNDSSIHSCNEKDVLSSAAYVLFYRRQTD